MDTVTLSIDGAQVEAPKGQNVLWAALDAGIYIPNLCALREVQDPFAGCRLCFVEIQGRPEPVTACTETVAQGMVVITDTPQVNRLRRMAAELLIADDPGDCPRCRAHRQCDLQRVAAHLGLKIKPTRLRHTTRGLPADDSSPYFISDPDRCVLCGKCVWACNERQGAEAIDFVFRGIETVVRPFAGDTFLRSRCESCGGCVQRCPTGALVAKSFRPPARREIQSVCPLCGVGCSLYLGLRKDTIVSVRGNENSPTSRGSLCAKGRFALPELVHHPGRLTTPLVRRNGRLEEATWEEALEAVAGGLARHRGEFALIGSAKTTNEEGYLLQKLARVVMGTNNIDQPSRLCGGPTLAALSPILGLAAMTNPFADIEGAASILAIGTNTTATHPIVGQRVRKAAREGARLIVANPYQVDLCRQAALWLRHRPGSDLALLGGMMRLILEEGLADTDFVQRRCVGFEAFEESLCQFDPEAVARATGLPREQLAQAARTFAQHEPGAILYGSGLTQHPGGTENVRALADLALLTGSLARRGGGLYPLHGQGNSQGAADMGLVPDLFPGGQPVSDPGARANLEQAWGCSLNPEPGLTFADIPEATAGGEIRALYVVGANPARTLIDTGQVRRALEALDFLVVQDMFLTETAELAQVVLPAASFAEKDGTFTNLERRVQRLRQALPPPGDSRPDWWITCQVARRMGARGFDFQHPSQVMEEIAHLVPSYAGISYQRLEEQGLPCPTRDHPGTPALFADDGTKFQFMPLSGHPCPAPPDPQYPLLLGTERSLHQFNTMTAGIEGLALLSGDPRARVNPADALALGLAEGDQVRLISPRGEVSAVLEVSEAAPPGMVYLSSPLASLEANVLTGGQRDPASGTPALRVCAVRLEKAHKP